MASNIAVLTTAVAIAASFALFSIECRHSSHQTVERAENHRINVDTVSTDGVASAEPEVHLIEMVSLGIYEEDWIDAGKQMTVGWINAFGDLKYGSSYCDRLVHHIRKSPANVLQIDRITDNGLAAIRQMPRLRALVLFNSNVTDASLRHLVDMPRLETVGFYYCKMTQDTVDRIQQLNPETHFEIYDPSKRGFVFDQSGCLSTDFLQTYRKKSSWR